MKILPLYAAALAILFVVLSLRIVRLRNTFKVGLGDAGNSQLQRAIRVHANFAEYIPLALLMVYLVETQGAVAWLVHGLGAALLIGRLSHAYGVSQDREDLRFRIAGMILTLSNLSISSAYLLYSVARDMY